MELLFTKNDTFSQGTRVRIQNGTVIYTYKKSRFDANSLFDLIQYVNFLNYKYPGVKFPIHISLGHARFSDKLAYVLLECVCSNLICSYGHSVSLFFEQKGSIHTAGIQSSPLGILGSTRLQNIPKYNERFKSEIYKFHYRRLLLYSQICTGDGLSVVMDELAYFQEMFKIDKQSIEAISETLTELVGNAGEHGASDCLVDLDIAPNYKKMGSDANYVGINIAIVNFSHCLLGTSIKKKILNPNISGERYLQVKNAYEKHLPFFNEEYTEEDFFNIATFQHKISGRDGNVLTGGTGLTKLIHSLESRSDAHMCYVLSGKKQIRFMPEYLRYNEDNWIGFNDSNDFINDIPAKGLISSHRLFFPGTAYNLNFVLRMEE